MFKDAKVFSSFSVNDLSAAKVFYGETLGLDVSEDKMGLTITIDGNDSIYIYPKDDHVPASFTVLNFVVDNIDHAVKDLNNKEISLEHYENLTDDNGIARGLSQNRGPDIAWFKDPAGNVLSVLQSS